MHGCTERWGVVQCGRFMSGCLCHCSWMRPELECVELLQLPIIYVEFVPKITLCNWIFVMLTNSPAPLQSCSVLVNGVRSDPSIFWLQQVKFSWFSSCPVPWILRYISSGPFFFLKHVGLTRAICGCGMRLRRHSALQQRTVKCHSAALSARRSYKTGRQNFASDRVGPIKQLYVSTVRWTVVWNTWAVPFMRSVQIHVRSWLASMFVCC